MNKKINQSLLIKSILVLSVLRLLAGCASDPVESNFHLAAESRLPKWAKIPQPYQRKDITMEITLHTSGKVRLDLYGPTPERKKIMEKLGMLKPHPMTEKTGYGVFPNYSIITVDGISEIYEQEKPEAILYITDAVRQLENK